MKDILPMLRCAVYTRKSTDEGLEQTFNSIDAQREAGMNYIAAQRSAGWVLIPTRYDDPDYSGGTFERPAFKQLMQDIEAGLLDCIVVYKMDRLSRSLVDFLNLEKSLRTKGVNIVSVTEQFSTDSAQGRLYLNMSMSFAQHEREIASERIRDKIAASKRRGLWMGGPPPLGYDCVDRSLTVNKTEAEIIRWIFKRFLELQSGHQLTKELREKGIRNKAYVSRRGVNRGGSLFGQSQIYRILRNPLFAGKITHGKKVYDGQHEAIVDADTWQQVQELLDTSIDRRPKPGRLPKEPGLLKEKLVCEGCQSAMTHNYTNKGNKQYCYYTPCAVRKGHCNHCQVKNVPAGEVDKAVLNQLHEIFRSPRILLNVWKRARERDPDVTEEDVIHTFKNVEAVWQNLFPTEQREIVNLLVRRVELSPKGAFVHLRLKGLKEVVKHLQKR